MVLPRRRAGRLVPPLVGEGGRRPGEVRARDDSINTKPPASEPGSPVGGFVAGGFKASRGYSGRPMPCVHSPGSAKVMRV